MKKITTTIICLSLTLTLLAGCGGTAQKNSDGIYTNAEYHDTNMKTVTGGDFNTNSNELCYYTREAGLGVILSEQLAEEKSRTKQLGSSVISNKGVVFGFNFRNEAEESADSKSGLNNNMTFCEMLKDEPYNNLFNLFGVWRDEDGKDQEDFDTFKSKFKHVEKIGLLANNTYYYGYNDDISSLDLTDRQKTILLTLVEEAKTIKETIVLFPNAEFNENSLNVDLTNFAAQTSEGKTVNQDIFKNYDLTMINIWSTWCGGCIKEMKDLQELYDMLPKNVNLISICADGSGESELMNKILAQNNVKFTTLVDGSKLNNSLLDRITTFPTTIFVDKNGNIVGKPQVGIPGESSDGMPLGIEEAGDIDIGRADGKEMTDEDFEGFEQFGGK